MDAFFKKIYRPQVLLIIIFIQTLALVKLLNSTITDYYISSSKVQAETSDDRDEDIRACLKLPVADRPACAKLIGSKLAQDSLMDIKLKVGQCMKLRPIFVRYCLEELRQSP